MDIFDYIEYIHSLGLDGVVINVIRDFGLTDWGTLDNTDEEHLTKVKNLLNKYGMYVELDMRNLEFDRLLEVIKVADFLGAELIRSYIPITINRENLINSAASGAYDIVKVKQDFDPDNLRKGIESIQKILPYLEKYRIRLCLENHEYETSYELVEVVKKIDSPWVGLLFDFGNSMMAWEDPIIAAKNMALYVFMTHCKDHIIIKDEGSDFGYVVCGVPIGEGNLPVREIFDILYKKAPIKRLNIEMCYPYCAEFKRSLGTGGVYAVGQGAFAVKDELYPELKPSQYYYPQEISQEWLEKLLNDQKNGLENSVKYIKEILKEYNEKVS